MQLGGQDSALLKVVYIYRVQISVWRLPNYWPPTPSPPSGCVLPPHQRRGDTNSPGGEGGWGWVNISKDARHWIGFLQYNPSTVLWQQGSFFQHTHAYTWVYIANCTAAFVWLHRCIAYRWVHTSLLQLRTRGCTIAHAYTWVHSSTCVQMGA